MNINLNKQLVQKLHQSLGLPLGTKGLSFSQQLSRQGLDKMIALVAIMGEILPEKCKSGRLNELDYVRHARDQHLLPANNDFRYQVAKLLLRRLVLGCFGAV